MIFETKIMQLYEVIKFFNIQVLKCEIIIAENVCRLKTPQQIQELASEIL